MNRIPWSCYKQDTRVIKIDTKTVLLTVHRHFKIDTEIVEYHATMESCSDKFHVDIPNVV
jgi:hypothetical protein